MLGHQLRRGVRVLPSLVSTKRPSAHQQIRALSTTNTQVVGSTTSFLRNIHNGAEIFLVGTAHVSKASADEVRNTIRLVKPDTVMVELCAGRAARIRSDDISDDNFVKNLLATILAPGASMSQKFVSVGIPMMYRGFKLLGMDPGAEFKVALEEADRIRAKVVYGDQDSSVTMQRLSDTVTMVDILQMMTGQGMPKPSPSLRTYLSEQDDSLESQVEAMKNRAVVREMGAYMRKVNPRAAAVMLDERDEYMVRQLSRLQGRVVGVVGLAHLDGIERRWEKLMYGRQSLASPR